MALSSVVLHCRYLLSFCTRTKGVLYQDLHSSIYTHLAAEQSVVLCCLSNTSALLIAEWLIAKSLMAALLISASAHAPPGAGCAKPCLQ